MGIYLARKAFNKGRYMNICLKQRLNEKWDYFPTCLDYSALLSLAENKFKISRNEARDRFGLFTYAQWVNVL
jgi:hypothetical protein